MTKSESDATATTRFSTEQFSWLQAELAREQDHYWSRFGSFSALHGGMLVLVTSDSLTNRSVLLWLAVGLGIIWFLVQWASLYYVDRLKPLYHEARQQQGFEFPKHFLFSLKLFSSTNLALLVPIALTALWLRFAVHQEIPHSPPKEAKVTDAGNG